MLYWQLRTHAQYYLQESSVAIYVYIPVQYSVKEVSSVAIYVYSHVQYSVQEISSVGCYVYTIHTALYNTLYKKSVV
jgi:hypothetical protein